MLPSRRRRYDGVVDGYDLTMLLANYTKSCMSDARAGGPDGGRGRPYGYSRAFYP